MTLRHLELLMERASLEDATGLRIFLQGFLQAELYIPTRQQNHPLSDGPEYPNEFFELLGVQDGEKTVLPCFSRSELIKEWCGNDLLYKTVSGEVLLQRVPEEWWIALNPGSGLEKEFSPWEIGQLKLGEEGISEVLEDLADSAEPFDPEVVQKLSSDRYLELRIALEAFCKQQKAVEALYLLLASEGDNEEIIVGLRISGESEEALGELREQCERVARKELIGAGELKVLAGLEDQPELALGIFQPEHLLFERKKGFLHNLKKLISSSS